MKVIKEPVPVAWSIEQTCVDTYSELGCGALLEVDYNDVYIKKHEKGYWSSSDQEFVHYMVNSYWFKCPCCGKENSLNEYEIPERIRQIILNKEKEKELQHGKKIKSKY